MEEKKDHFHHLEWTHSLRSMELQLAGEYIDGDVVIDFGAGDGFCVKALGERKSTVFGFDPLPRLPSLAPVYSSVDELSEAMTREKAGVILSVHVLEHIHAIGPALEQMLKFTNRDVKLIAVVPSVWAGALTSLLMPVAYIRNIFHLQRIYKRRCRNMKPNQILKFLMRTLNPVRILIWPGHGIHTWYRWIVYWRDNSWKKRLEVEGWQVEKIIKGRLSYSLHKLFPGRFINLRQALSDVGLPGSKVIIAKRINEKLH